MNNKIDQLKNALPPISQVVPGLKRKTENELCGPCPFPLCCANHDGFVVFIDTGRFLCRRCTPEGGDVIDFFCKHENTDIPGLMSTYLSKQHTVTGHYDYQDQNGNALYYKERIEPGRNGRAKEFFFYHGNRQKGRGCEPVLYNLQDVVKSDSIIICEGEKHCDLLKSWGITATTLDSGSQSKLTPRMIEQLSGKQLVILRDNDAPGLAYAMTIANALHGKCRSIKIILLPGLPEKGDIIDWASETENDYTRLQEIIGNTPEWKPEEQAKNSVSASYGKYKVVALEDFISQELPPRRCILYPWLPEQGLCMLYAIRGLGKTFMALGIGLSVSSGSNFLNWYADNPAGVLYVDGEMPAAVLQERLKELIKAMGVEPQSSFKIFTPDLQEFGMPDLATLEGQDVLESFITDDIKLVIIDNLSCLCRTGKENEAESWISIQEYALRLRARGISVLFIHHAGKGGSQRGTSKREDVLDTVINLRTPVGSSAKDGLNAEVHFEKCRSMLGDDAEPFIVKLTHDSSKNLSWSLYPLEDAIHEKIIKCHSDGLHQKEIAEELGIHKSTVSRHLKNARENGEIKDE